MKEQLVSLLVSQVGLDQEQAEQSIDKVMQYLQENPDMLKGLLGQTGLGGITDKLGGMF